MDTVLLCHSTVRQLILVSIFTLFNFYFYITVVIQIQNFSS